MGINSDGGGPIVNSLKIFCIQIYKYPPPKYIYQILQQKIVFIPIIPSEYEKYVFLIKNNYSYIKKTLYLYYLYISIKNAEF